MIVQSKDFEQSLKALNGQKIVFIDTETNGLDPFSSASICGVGVGFASGETFYFPFRHLTLTDGYHNLPEKDISRLIQVLNKVKVLVGYNIKFDLKFLMKENLVISDQELIDVIVMCRLTDPERFAKLSLTDQIITSFGQEAGQYDINTKEIMKKSKWMKDFSLTPISILGPYCEKDVYWTQRLYIERSLQIKKTNQTKIWDMEKELTKVLLLTEKFGITIDLNYCNSKLIDLQARQKTLESRIYKSLGQEFLVGSNQQIGKAFNSVGIQSPVITKAGNQSWDEIVLAGIQHDAAGMIREWRTLDKMKSTYLEPFLDSGGTVRTTFCNWGTVTGRLSSREPNLQNIPRFMIPMADMQLSETQKTELKNRIEALLKARRGGESVQVIGGSSLMSWGFTGDEHYDDSRTDIMSLRRLFVARPGYKLISFDYSQMEIRVFLSYLQSEEIVSLMKTQGFDFHSHAAKMAFGVDKSHADFKFYRQMAKAITFGVIYGIGLDRLAMQMGKSKEEAKEYKNKYFMGIPGARNFIKTVVKTAESRGYVFNRFGRRYWIPKDKSYVAVNYLVQGTSADILSHGMCQVNKYLQETNSRMLIQVHDEIICEVEEDKIKEICLNVKKILEDNPLKIPLEVDIAICDPSWAHKKDIQL